MALMSGKRRFDEKVMQNCQFHGHLPCMPCLHRASTMHAVVYPNADAEGCVTHMALDQAWT